MKPLVDKYRPVKLVDFAGLGNVRAMLQRFAKDPYASAWLFTGDAGVGKTTMAYALAAEIGAEVHHVTSRGCNLEVVNQLRHDCSYYPFGGSMHAVRNPHMEGSADMDNYKVTLIRRAPAQRLNPSSCEIETDMSRQGKIAARMTLHFSKGIGHHGKEPEVAEVLDCLASDAAIIENCPTFEDFCSELGYDTDSRKAEKNYKATEHQTTRLKNFLGDDLYDLLLWHTERQ